MIKVTFFQLLLVGLATCAPQSSQNTDNKRNLFGANTGIGVTPPIVGFFNGISDIFKYNGVEAAKCANDFATLDKTKLIKLQNGKLYYFPTGTLPYADAKAYCDSRGMRIVVLETLAESLLLSEYLSKLYTATGNFEYTFIGVRALTTGSGIYTLEYSNAPLTYSHWYTGQPVPVVDCVAIEAYTSLAETGWLTDDCTNSNNFVCELPARCNRYLQATLEIFDGL